MFQQNRTLPAGSIPCYCLFTRSIIKWVSTLTFLFLFSTALQSQNNAISFDGTNDNIAVPALGNGYSQFTIETWINASALAGSSGFNGIYNTNSWVAGDIHLQLNNTKIELAVNGSNIIDVPCNSITINTWHHLAVSYNSVTKLVKVYINGNLLQSATMTTAVSANFTASQIGAWTTQRYYAGMMDDYRIWNTERSPDEIKNNMSASMAGTESGLLASFSFNQGTAGGTNTGITTLLNAKGSNNGTLINFALTGATSNWVTGIKDAPDAHVSNLTSTLAANKMTLTWTDATGSILPDGYLICANKTNSFTNPVDGILPADDNDLSDGSGVVMVAKGIQTYNGWINEDFNTTYNFKIFPLTNPGILVKYYTSGSVPQIQVVSKQILIQVTSNFPHANGPIFFDYNNDGYLDPLYALDIGEKTALYRNNQNNTYSLVTYFNSPGFEYPGGIVDFDINGYLDVIGVNTSRIYFNNNGASFTATPVLNAGLPNPAGEWADFDSDADLDFLTRGSNGYDIKIFRRDQGFYNELFGNSFRPCEGIFKWIDFNNDGYPDILASGKNPLDNKLYTTLYKNEGKGRFSEQTQISLPVLEYVAISIADINSDGRMDIILNGNRSDNTGTVILCTNNGGTNFTTLTIGEFYDCQNGPAGVVDIDNDGLNDILISAGTSETESIVKIFRNNGNGTFSDMFVQNLPYAAPGLDLFDVNNDGNIDLVEKWDMVFQNAVTSSNLAPDKITTATSVLEGNGVRLNWNATDDKTPSAGLTYELRIGTSPGASNIIAASSIGSGKRKLLTSGNMGTLTTKYLQLPKGTYYWSVQAIDNSFKGGTFSDEKTFTITDVPSSKLTAEKLDIYSLKLKWTQGNGTKRTVFCKIGTAGTATPVNNKSYIASPNFGEGDQIGTTGWYCVYNGAGDSLNVFKLSSSNSYIFHVTEYFGNSGSESYVVTTANGNPGVFSTAVFSEQPAIPVPQNDGYDSRIYLGDFNNDNLLDFLYNYSGVITYNINQGNNSYTQTTVTSSRLLNNSLVNVVDYNNDGWLDYSETGDYYVNYWSSPTYTRFFTNNGNNTFTENLDLNSVGTIKNSMAWGDYDNDGNLDYFIGGDDATVIGITDWPYVQTNYTKISKIFRNNGPAGSYSFTEQADIIFPGLSAGAAKWSDFNNDGWPDLLFTGVADDNNYYIYLYINNKNNSFTGHQIGYNSTANPGNFALKSYLECADFDKDGFPDFILSTDGDYGQSNGKATLFRNNGDNTFTQDNTVFSDQTTFNQFSIGDFDNDKAVDVLFMRAGTQFKRLYKNNYPNKSFSVMADFVSSGSSDGTLALGDYDNDGDLDVISSCNSDYSGVCNIIKNSTIMKSGTFPANNLPSAPMNIKTTLTPGQLLISWDKVTTDETSNLSYNLKLEKDGLTINSPNTNLPGSKRKVPEMGNTGMNNFAVMKGLLAGTYSISVQAIDGVYAGGAWSAPVTVELKNTKAFFTFDTVCYKVATKLSDLSTSTKKITSRKWKYNNTVISTDSVARFVFPNSGTGNITLVITDGEGTKDSVTHAIKVKPRPTASYSATTVCLGTTTTFANNSSRNGAGTVIWNWNYDNGDPASTDSIPINKVYGLAKTYKTKLIVTASNGCADTLAKDVIVGAIPNALTSVTGKTVFCQGDSVQLIAENNPLYNYQWKLDNNDLTNTNLSTYKVKLNSGAYSVKITNPLANCIATSAITNVTVLPAPASPYISESGLRQFCQGDSVVLSVTNTAGYDYQWKLNGGAVGINKNSFAAKASGNYTVTVSNSSGCEANSSNLISVTVFPKPSVSTISRSGVTTFCQGSSVELSVPANASYTYQWQNSGSDIQGATTNKFTALNSGVYSLYISNSDGCVTKTEQVTVNSLTAPVPPSILYSKPLPIQFCEGDSVTLSASNIAGYSYQWKLNGGAAGTNLNSIVVRTGGTWSLVVSNSSGCSAESTNSPSVVVYPKPAVSSISKNGPATICAGESVELSVPSITGYKYQWSRSGADIDGANSSYYSAFSSGDYSLLISNSDRCTTKTDHLTVVVNKKPEKPVIDKGNYSEGKCLGETPVKLSVENMAGYSYKWYRNGAAVSSKNFVKGLLEQGYYFVETSVNNCSNKSDSINVFFAPAAEKPKIFAQGPNSWYLASSIIGPDVKYRWFYNGVLIPGADKYYYAAFRQLGKYNLSISRSNSCYTLSDTIKIPLISTILGIDDTDPFNGMKIYPNPTSGLFTIEMDNELFGVITVDILSQDGRKILSLKFDKSTTHFFSKIDISGQGKGLYLMHIKLDKYSKVEKLILE